MCEILKYKAYERQTEVSSAQEEPDEQQTMLQDEHLHEHFSGVMVDKQNIDLWQPNVYKESKRDFYVKAQLEIIFSDHCPATCYTEHVYTTSDSGDLTYLIWVCS